MQQVALSLVTSLADHNYHFLVQSTPSAFLSVVAIICKSRSFTTIKLTHLETSKTSLSKVQEER